MALMLVDAEEWVRQRKAAWDDGFQVGAAIGVGLTLAACGMWALLAGVWS